MEGYMSSKQVLLLTRTVMNNEMMETFKSLTPPGWQAIVMDLSQSDQKIEKAIQDSSYILIRDGVPLPIRLVEKANNLKLIQNGGQDTGHLPVKWALEKGVPVANAGGTNAVAVAEFTVLLMLSCLKRLLPFNQSLREGKYSGNMGRKGSKEMFDKTVGIVGFGNIGRRVAKLCYAFGANIIYYERLFIPYSLRADFKAKPVDLDELLSESDIVSLHVPTQITSGAMFGWEEFNKMKPTAYFINTSRGTNVNEKALYQALVEKRIAGAGLDVWSPEPPEKNNPLLNLPNVVATPHVAGVSWENTALSFEMMWKNVVLVSQGKEPLNRIRNF
jgi:phosphoglycerate dehydrogenase-like enzyme